MNEEEIITIFELEHSLISIRKQLEHLIDEINAEDERRKAYYKDFFIGDLTTIGELLESKN